MWSGARARILKIAQLAEKLLQNALHCVESLELAQHLPEVGPSLLCGVEPIWYVAALVRNIHFEAQDFIH